MQLTLYFSKFIGWFKFVENLGSAMWSMEDSNFPYLGKYQISMSVKKIGRILKSADMRN